MADGPDYPALLGQWRAAHRAFQQWWVTAAQGRPTLEKVYLEATTPVVPNQPPPVDSWPWPAVALYQAVHALWLAEEPDHA